MQLLSRLHAAGRTIVVVLHDLNIAAQYCERLVLLDKGRIAAEGTRERDPRSRGDPRGLPGPRGRPPAGRPPLHHPALDQDPRRPARDRGA